MNLGGTEVFVILFIVILLFGAKKIPELARGLGKGIREFKDASSGIKSEIENSMNERPADSKEKTGAEKQ
jgi:sec-independent protein translocase protein TatA